MKLITPRFAFTVFGGITGGNLMSSSEGESFVASTLGVGIGAYVANKFEFSAPRQHKMLYKEKDIVLGKTLSEVDKMKAELLADLSTRKLTLPGKEGVPFKIEDIYGTLHEANIEQAIRDASSIEDLRRIKIAAYNPERFSSVKGPDSLPGSAGLRTNAKIFIKTETEEGKEVALKKLEQKFKAMGYIGEELDTKLAMFKVAIKDSDSIVLNSSMDKLIVESSALYSKGQIAEYKLVSSPNVNDVATTVDTNNIYTVRRLNPFAKMVVNNPELQARVVSDGTPEPYVKDAERFLQAMGVDLSDVTPRDRNLISKAVSEAKYKGFSPEDLKALLSSTPLGGTEALDAYIDTAYKHLQDESALRAKGYSRQYIEDKLTDLGRRFSHQQDFSLSFGQDGKLVPIGNKAFNGQPSEARQFRSLLGGYADDGKKADHNNIANWKMQESVFNINSPMERNPFTASREVRHENKGENAVARAWKRLREAGMVPREFDTAIAAKRVAVDEDAFNKVASILFPESSIGITDGGAVANREVWSTYNTTGQRTFKISPDKGGDVLLSDKVINYLRDTARYALGAHRTPLTEATKEAVMHKIQTEGESALLEDILKSMLAKEGVEEAVERYNSLISTSFKPGEVLGIHGNGVAVKIPKEFESYTLQALNFSFADTGESPRLQANLVMKGVSNLGALDVFKTFGSDSKENLVMAKDFDEARAVQRFLEKYTVIDDNTFQSKSTGEVISATREELDAIAKRLLNTGIGDDIGSISSFSSTGQGVAEHVVNAFQQEDVKQALMAMTDGHTTKMSVSERVAEGIAALAVGNKHDAWAIGQLTASITEGKASAASLLGMTVLGAARAEADLALMNRGLARGSFTKGEKEAAMRLEALGVKSMEAFYEKARALQSHYSTPESMARFINSGQAFSDSTVGMFKYAYKDYGVSLTLASPDASQGFATGSGKVNKTISHMAQKQLLAAGLSDSLLSLFGELDPHQLYDTKALTTLDRDMKNVPTFNKFLDSLVYEDKYVSKEGFQKAQTLLNAVLNGAPEEITNTLAALGAPQELIDQEFLRFELRDNAHKLTNVPIFKVSTTRYGEYISQDERAAGKPLQKITQELVREAFLDQYSPSRSTPAKLERLTSQYVKTWTGMVGNSNNPMLKTVTARHAPNSSYQKVIGVQGESFGKLVDAYQAQGKSVAGVSREKATQLVQNYLGVKIESLDKYLGEGGVLSVPTKEGNMVPLYTFLNREPTHTSFSIAPYALRVMEDGNAESVYIHSKDKHYTSLMFGDFDNDHVLMYSLSKQISDKEAAELEKYTSKLAEVRNDLIPLIKGLSVKGKSESGLYDVSKAISYIEENIEKYMPKGFTKETYIGSDAYYEEIGNLVNERRQNASTKGGVRKTLSPSTVQLSVELASAITNSTILNNDFLTFSAAKTINHALVENILKTQHIDTETFPAELEVEKIFQLRKRLAQGSKDVKVEDYRTALTGFLKELMTNAKQDEGVISLEKKISMSFNEMIDTIAAEDIRNIKDPRYAPSSILGYAKTMLEVEKSGFDAQMLSGYTRDMLTGVYGDNLSLVETLDVETNIGKSSNLAMDEAYRSFKSTLKRNKSLLTMGATAAAGVAFITQDDFRHTARADTQASTVAPATVSQMQTRDSDAALISLGRDKNEYVRPSTGLERVKQNYTVSARHQGNAEQQELSAKEAIFGNNITNVNINMRGAY